MRKAYSITDGKKRKFKFIELKGEWKRHLGEVEQSGSSIVYGKSGEGKTSYALLKSKAICEAQKVLYNTAEEGYRASWVRSLDLNNMSVVKSKFSYCKEQYDEFFKRLKKKRRPKVVVIDSVQYFFLGKKKADYFKLIETFNETHFIFLSHISKGLPEGPVAMAIYWDCQNRILVQDFKAYVEKSRCGADEKTPLIINQKIADERELKLLKQ